MYMIFLGKPFLAHSKNNLQKSLPYDNTAKEVKFYDYCTVKVYDIGVHNSLDYSKLSSYWLSKTPWIK